MGFSFLFAEAEENSLRHGLRRASSLGEGASGEKENFAV